MESKACFYHNQIPIFMLVENAKKGHFYICEDGKVTRWGKEKMEEKENDLTAAKQIKS